MHRYRYAYASEGYPWHEMPPGEKSRRGVGRRLDGEKLSTLFGKHVSYVHILIY